MTEMGALPDRPILVVNDEIAAMSRGDIHCCFRSPFGHSSPCQVPSSRKVKQGKNLSRQTKNLPIGPANGE